MFMEQQSRGWLLTKTEVNKVSHRVLLIPGLMGTDYVFSKLMNEKTLADNEIQLFAGNPPGFKGQPIPEGFGFSIQEYAQSVEDLCKNEKIDLILGHSFGANVLIEVSERNIFKGKLMLISPSLDRDAETKEMKMLDSMTRKPILSSIMWQLTYLSMKTAFAPYFKKEEELKKIVSEAKKAPIKIAKSIFIGYFDYISGGKNLLQKLSKSENNIYYLRGDGDDIIITDDYKKVLETSPNIKFFTIKNSTHFAMCDNPKDIAELILKQIKE